MLKSFYLVLFVFAQGKTAFATNSQNEIATFYGCYSRLTGRQPKPTLSSLNKIKSGSLTGLEACFQLIDSLELTENGQIQSSDDSSSLYMLQNFHRLHSSWFSNKSLASSITFGNCVSQGTEEYFDSTTPALYFTKILADENFEFNRLLTGKAHLQSIRETAPSSTHGAVNNVKLDTVTGVGNQSLSIEPVMAGKIIGIKNAKTFKIPNISSDYEDDPVGFHSGGGVLGDSTYLMMSLGQANYRTDGDVKAYRKYSQAIFSDLLCRDLPVLRLSDVSEMIMKSPHAPFKQINGCVHCHATMDPMAGLVRNQTLTKSRVGACSTSNRQLALLRRYIVNQKRTDTWTSKPFAKYYQSPAEGTIYYRTLNGQLVNQKVENLEAAGQVLLKQDDVFACAAKRYYQHFTGVGVDMRDIYDPLNPLELDSEQLRHRKIVVGLGQRLKKHQSLKRLIKEILLQPSYSQTPTIRQPASLEPGGF